MAAPRRKPASAMDAARLTPYSSVDSGASPACTSLSLGGIDLAADLGVVDGELELLFARSKIVVAARAAGKPPPSDGYASVSTMTTGFEASAKAHDGSVSSASRRSTPVRSP